MTPQTFTLSSKISAEKSAAVLMAMRSWAVAEGCWSEENQAQYKVKFEQLSRRWK